MLVTLETTGFKLMKKMHNILIKFMIKTQMAETLCS